MTNGRIDRQVGGSLQVMTGVHLAAASSARGQRLTIKIRNLNRIRQECSACTEFEVRA